MAVESKVRAADPVRTAGIVFNIIFWGVFIALRYPATYWDDSLIVAPALGLLSHGVLDNIYLSKEFYPAPVYLFYPPTFFFVLAAWMAIFGKAIVSLSGFWAVCGLVSSLSLAGLLQRLEHSPVVWVVAPVLVFGCVAYTGYRYEVLGFATLLAGVALGTGRLRAIGYGLLFVTPTIAPTMVGAAIVAIAAIFAHRHRGRTSREAAMAGAALAVAIIILVASVSGAIGALIKTMYDYRGVRVGVGGRDLSLYKYVAAVMGLGLATAALQRWKIGRRGSSIYLQLPLLLVAAMAVTMVTHARPSMIVAFNIAIVTIFIISACQALAPKADGARAAAFGLGLWGVGLAVLNFGYMQSVAVPQLSPGLSRQARNLVAGAPSGATVVADARVVKDALGFPVRGQLEDAMVRHAWPAYAQDYHRIPVSEYWVISRAALIGSIDPAAAPADRSRLDVLFIASGMAKIGDDRICAIDTATSQKWSSENPADLIALACRPRPEN
jgi:hypothetical protein